MANALRLSTFGVASEFSLSETYENFDLLAFDGVAG